MTDRYHALSVCLEKDIRQDDAELLISAIKQMRGVRDVAGSVSNLDTWSAECRARGDLCQKIYAVLQEKA